VLEKTSSVASNSPAMAQALVKVDDSAGESDQSDGRRMRADAGQADAGYQTDETTPKFSTTKCSEILG
jgi:hypothetical protein